MINGKKITLGGEEFVCPPVNIATLKKHAEFFERLKEGKTDDDFSTMADIVFRTLARNYPNLTQERVDDLLDINNVADAFKALMSVSGFEKKVGKPEAANP